MHEILSMVHAWGAAYRAAFVIACLDVGLWLYILNWYLQQMPLWRRYHAEVRIAQDEAKTKARRRAVAGQRPF